MLWRGFRAVSGFVCDVSVRRAPEAGTGGSWGASAGPALVGSRWLVRVFPRGSWRRVRVSGARAAAGMASCGCRTTLSVLVDPPVVRSPVLAMPITLQTRPATISYDTHPGDVTCLTFMSV